MIIGGGGGVHVIRNDHVGDSVRYRNMMTQFITIVMITFLREFNDLVMSSTLGAAACDKRRWRICYVFHRNLFLIETRRI